MLDEILMSSIKLPNKSGIYCITNIYDNKIYIGSSYNIKKRIGTHKSLLSTNKHYNIYLQNVYNKLLGLLIFSVIELCDESLLSSKEQYYIDKYQSYNPKYGYNLQKIVDERSYPTEITRKKISENRKGKGLSNKEFCDCGLKYTLNCSNIKRCKPCNNKKQREKRLLEALNKVDLRKTDTCCRKGHSYIDNPPLVRFNKSRGRNSKYCKICDILSKQNHYQNKKSIKE